jgi:hypothetical protein
MGKARDKRRSSPFVMVYKDMLHSPAWESLSNPARVAYLHIKADYNGYNEGNLKLPYSQAEKVMDKKTFTRALRQLQEHGFIVVTEHGGLFNRCTTFALSNAWRGWRPSTTDSMPHAGQRCFSPHLL